MTQWARPPQQRDQMVLFAQRLDDALPPDHVVRLLHKLLAKVDEATATAERGLRSAERGARSAEREEN